MLETFQMIKKWWPMGLAASLGLFIASCSWGFYSYDWDYVPIYTARAVYLVDNKDSTQAYARLARSEMIKGDIQGIESRSDGLFLVIEASNGNKMQAVDNLNRVSAALAEYVATLPKEDYGAVRSQIDSSVEVSNKPNLWRSVLKSVLLGLGLGALAFLFTPVATQALVNELRGSRD